MPGGVSRHNTQTVTTFAFETMDQTPRFFVSEFGCFTTPIAEHGPLLALKFACHCPNSFSLSRSKRNNIPD